jgi:hypothetical protein
LGYSLKGKRKMEAHSELPQTEEAARDAIKRIAEGTQDILELSNRDLEQYQRSKDVLAPFNVELDIAAREYADLLTILGGCGTPREAVRFFLKNHAKELPRITVKDAVEKCLA